MPAITINGKVYANPDDVPVELRSAYLKALEVVHDTNGNGIPDFLEGKPARKAGGLPINLEVEADTRFVVGDNVFARLDDLPPEARMKYDQAKKMVAKILPDSNSDGIPDLLEGMPGGAALPRQPSTTQIFSRDSMPSVFQDESTDIRRAIKLAVFITLLLVLVGFAGYAFLFLYN